MNAVWDESSTQASDMLGKFTEPSTTGEAGETNGTFAGFKTLTINMIGSVCFGTRRSWAEAVGTEAPPGCKMTFMKSILTIVDNLFVAVFLSPKLLKLRLMPRTAQKVGVAKTEFPLHLRDSIAQERRSPSSRNTLIA